MDAHKQEAFVHPSAVADMGCVLGKGTKIWHFSHLMAQCEIGENCIVGQNVFIAGRVKIGNNVKIQNNVSVYEGVIVEDDVFIGPSAVFTNVINPRSFIERKDSYQATILKKGCSIGANATIVCGCTIGHYALIGAGSVVTKDIPNYALIVGNPGRAIGWVSKRGCRLQFDGNGSAFCPESGEAYLLQNGQAICL